MPITPLPAIEDYGLIGDTRTAALVGPDGSIDWMCTPGFDGEPIFGRLVGGAAAGRFTMGPARPVALLSRRYRPETATLETTWRTDTGELTLTEGMVAEVAGSLLPSTLMVRRLTVSGGPVDAVIEFCPRRGEQHRPPRIQHRGNSVVCSWGATALAISSDPSIGVEPGRPTMATVESGRPLTVCVAATYRGPLIHVNPAAAWTVLEKDEGRWRNWSREVDADLPHRDLVVRSLLTLRLLTYSPSGAPVAAPTTSLPEDPGGVRNWDYRFAWPRDASIGIAAFLGSGKVIAAQRFLGWLLHASRLDRPRLPVLLTLYGRHPRDEHELAGWEGYARSRPVRVGNGAARQHQLDGYGWVVDAAWLLEESGHPLYSETWRAMRGFADEVARRWRAPDAGIWEVRGDGAHHVHSKLMAWLALDRALRLANGHRTSRRRRSAWERERDAIAADIRRYGFDPQLGAYTRAYGSEDLDAAVLLLPVIGLEPSGSTRVRGTIDAIARELDAGGPLVYRYPPGRDGLPGGEGAFLPCSFWLVQALAVTGRTAEAEKRFDELASLSSPLGLYAEEIDPLTRRHLGNYPQALTHAALLQAALSLRSPATTEHKNSEGMRLPL